MDEEVKVAREVEEGKGRRESLIMKLALWPSDASGGPRTPGTSPGAGSSVGALYISALNSLVLKVPPPSAENCGTWYYVNDACGSRVYRQES